MDNDNRNKNICIHMNTDGRNNQNDDDHTGDDNNDQDTTGIRGPQHWEQVYRSMPCDAIMRPLSCFLRSVHGPNMKKTSGAHRQQHFCIPIQIAH